MTIAFWASVALLLGGAMLFVLPPLLRPAGTKRPQAESPLAAYRDQRAQLDAELAQGTLTKEQHAQALDELQARVVDEVGEVDERPAAQPSQQSTALIVAIALAIPAGALALYGVLGTPAALQGDAQVASAGNSPHAMSQEQMESMVQQLADKLKKNPGDGNGWHMLARSYVAFQRLPEAAEAYDKAYKLMPGDANLLADYADVLAMVNGRSLEGRPEQLVKEALKVDPQHQKSLALIGTAAFNRGDFRGAADWWKKLLATLPPGSDQARAVEGNIAQAESEAAKGATQQAARPAAAGSPPAATAAAPTAKGPGSVEGTVSVADQVKASLPAGATLYIYARPADGSRMPLAIKREAAGSFPLRFKLDDSMAMSPEARLSLQGEVLLVARISRTGNAMPQPGDLTGTLGPVKVGARDLKLVINEVVK